jgi:glycosyltransferase involved in cell wall biosynthesis
MLPLNILISAYSCQPHQGSEPGVGWHLVQEIAKYHRVWVLTRSQNQAAIEAELAQHPVANLTVVYCDPPTGWRRLPPARVPHYYGWQVGAYFTAQTLLQTVAIDLIHHVTYVRYSTPSFLALLPVPFVWGPVGGGEMAPAPFWVDFGPRGRGYEVLRSLVHRLGELDPFTRLTARRSCIVQATTPDTAQRLQAMGATAVQVAAAIGLSAQELNRLTAVGDRPLPTPAPLRAISVARLLHWKGLHLGLRAFAQAAIPDDSEYWIVGEGPELANLRALTADLGLGDRVKFLGNLPRDRVLDCLTQAQVLIHPSLHESGGFVCLEAMAAGLPVLCLDLGGPSLQVTDETGFKIPAHHPDQAVQGLATALATLSTDPALGQRLGAAGRERVQQHFSWEAKGQALSDQYTKLCHKDIPCAF